MFIYNMHMMFFNLNDLLLLNLFNNTTNGFNIKFTSILFIGSVLTAIVTIAVKNTIVGLLFLISLFVLIGIYLYSVGLEFLGFGYILVYVGAVKFYAGLVKIQLCNMFLISIKFFQNFYYGFYFSNLKINNFNNYSFKSNFNQLNSCRRFYSVLSSKSIDEEFLRWFVGFSDGESNFTIVLLKDKEGNIKGVSFRFIIELHVDDIDALKYIKSKLNIGNEIAVYGNSCKFSVIHRNDIIKLISIFEKYPLNTSKYLDYLDFKKAFELYSEFKACTVKEKKKLIDKLISIKSGMNNGRVDFNFPSYHKIEITSYWLLGLIEAEGSFYVDRFKLQPSFIIGLSEVQGVVIRKIKEYLENNLGFDSYSMFKLQNSSFMAIVVDKGRGNTKPMLRFKITNTLILVNYFIPFLDQMTFITKKSKDYRDFKIICTAISKGAYRNNDIKELILKLSYTMNNYRLSNNSDLNKVSFMSSEDIDKIKNAESTILLLKDGRQLDSISKKEISGGWTNCVYEIIDYKGEIVLASTLNVAADCLSVRYATVSRQLNKLEGEFTIIEGKKIRRVSVFTLKDSSL
nr:hypothetical protein [Ceratocystis fimbriata]WPM94805.1 hypothetical protein [Ceratocystis fimbriata]